MLYVVFWVICSAGVIVSILPASRYLLDELAIAACSIMWPLFTWLQFRDNAIDDKGLVRALVAFHIMSAIYIIGVVGVTSPAVFTWSLLIVASAIYTGFRGGILSWLCLVLVMLAGAGLEQLPTVTLACMVIGLISLVATYVIHQAQSDQKELDESNHQASLQRDRTTTLVNNLTDAVISTDQNAKIVLYNAATLNLLDTNIDLDGKNIDEILQLRNEDGQIVSLSEKLYDTSTANHRDDLVTLISGETTRLDIAYSPIRSSYDEETEEGGEAPIGGFIIIMRDITKSKSLEEERDEFISVVSHELRTPITITEGTISNALLMLEHDNVAPDKIKSAIDMAHEQVVFLARMVNDLSTLSRAERGVADEAEEIDVNQLVEGIFTEHESEAAEKNLQFNLNLESGIGIVKVSRLYLKELLQNFVTNAIKYTREGSITIDVKLSGNKVRFSVIDTGIGISQADQKQIFDKFYRAEDYRTRESSGTGLGLYVAAKLAKKLDTNIDIKSRLNHGSEFSFKIPLHEPSDAQP